MSGWVKLRRDLAEEEIWTEEKPFTRGQALVDLLMRVTFRLTLLENEGTPKSKAITWDTVETCLDYGEYSGIGQWHNGGWGRFVWERMPDDTAVEA